MFRSAAITLALCFATVTAQAALLGRAALTPGGTDYQAYYDDRLNITWLADANLAATNTFGVAGICLDNIPPCPSAGPLGSMDWYVAQDWIAAMNSASYLGVNNWRLPSADVNGDNVVRDCRFAPGALCRDNEMSFQYWRNGIQTSAMSPFTNVASYVGFGYYGSGTEYAADPDRRWILNFGVYINDLNPKSAATYVWAVSPGDLLAVPIPAGIYLFGSALAVMGWMRRRAG
jgi:hypothetical protein